MRKDNGVRTPPVFSFRILNTYHAQHTTLTLLHSTLYTGTDADTGILRSCCKPINQSGPLRDIPDLFVKVSNPGPAATATTVTTPVTTGK